MVVEPLMVASKHLGIELVAFPVDKVNLEKRLASDKIPDYTLLLELIGVIEDIIDSLPGYLPTHTFLRVFADEIAVFTSKLAIFGDDKSYIACG